MSRSNDIAGLTTSILDGVTAAEVGLGNVDNTSDANKPVSTAQQTALNAKASLSGATFTGDITMPTNKKVKQKGAFMQSSTHQSLVLGY